MIRILSIIAMIVVLVVPAFVYQRLEWLDSLGYLGFFAANYFGYGLYILPFLVTRLNPVLLILIGAFGSTIDEIFAWYVGKTGELHEKPSKLHEKVARYIHRYGLFGIFVMGVVPTPGFIVTIAAYISGHFQIPFKKYFIAGFSGRLISRTIWTLGFLYASERVAWF